MMNTLFENDRLVIEANPHYYDYCHEIRLNNKTMNFNLADGGGQKMNEMYNGHFELTDDTLILHFENQEDWYSKTTVPIKTTNILKYKLSLEEKKHFDGYCMKISKYTIIFQKSPFSMNDDREIEFEYSYPLTFYTKLTDVKCNTLLERLKRNREYFFTELFEDYPELIKDDIYVKFKNEYEKQILSVTDDVLIKIMNLTNDMFKHDNTPLRFITWLCNVKKSVIFYQSDMKTLFAVEDGEITTWYYGHIKKGDINEQNESRIKTYEFPKDYKLIKENILSYSNNKNKPEYDLLYSNLQKFRIETSNLFEI